MKLLLLLGLVVSVCASDRAANAPCREACEAECSDFEDTVLRLESRLCELLHMHPFELWKNTDQGKEMSDRLRLDSKQPVFFADLDNNANFDCKGIEMMFGEARDPEQAGNCCDCLGSCLMRKIESVKQTVADGVDEGRFEAEREAALTKNSASLETVMETIAMVEEALELNERSPSSYRNSDAFLRATRKRQANPAYPMIKLLEEPSTGSRKQRLRKVAEWFRSEGLEGVYDEVSDIIADNMATETLSEYNDRFDSILNELDSAEKELERLPKGGRHRLISEYEQRIADLSVEMQETRDENPRSKYKIMFTAIRNALENYRASAEEQHGTHAAAIESRQRKRVRVDPGFSLTGESSTLSKLAGHVHNVMTKYDQDVEASYDDAAAADPWDDVEMPAEPTRDTVLAGLDSDTRAEYDKFLQSRRQFCEVHRECCDEA